MILNQITRSETRQQPDLQKSCGKRQKLTVLFELFADETQNW